MTRPLLIVIALSFLTSIVCFGIASSMGRLDWSKAEFWDFDGDFGPDLDIADGPQVTRTLAWTGDDELTVNVSADVEYVQGPDAKMVITGPKGYVEALTLNGDDRLSYRHRVRHAPRVKVVLTAPDVSEFTMNGSQRLNINGFDHDKLEVTINGSGKVTGAGKADRLEVNIHGSGDADFGQLATDRARVSIAGSGDATVAPKDAADVSIAGSGDVILKTRPATLETRIAGSGRIIQETPAEPSAVTPAPTAPTPRSVAPPAKTAA